MVVDGLDCGLATCRLCLRRWLSIVPLHLAITKLPGPDADAAVRREVDEVVDPPLVSVLVVMDAASRAGPQNHPAITEIELLNSSFLMDMPAENQSRV